VTGRIGKSSTGEKFVEFTIADEPAKSRFFSVRELNESDGSALIEWLTKVNIPVVGTSEKRIIEAPIGQCARTALLEHVGAPTLIADRPGWNGPAFVSRYGVHVPEGVSAVPAGSVQLQERSHLKGLHLKEFRRFARRYGRGNDLVTFMICAGFVGPLLPLLPESELLWLLLIGEPARGKTSLLNTVASIYGGDPRGRLRLLESLSATDNAAETFSEKGRHLIVPFDDTQALPSDAKQRATILSNVIFRTFQGIEKARLNQSQRVWESVFMLGSNERLQATLERGGVPYGGYTAVRAIELPVSNENGIFSHVPKGERPADFVRGMVRDAMAIRGLAGERFIKRLVDARHEDGSKLVSKLSRWQEELRRRLDPSGDSGERSRVVDHFALVYAAGCLASSFEVLPWTPKKIRRAVSRMYRRHIQARQEAAPVQAETYLRQYIHKNRGAFIRVEEGQTLPNWKVICSAPGVDFRCRDGSKEYCFLPQQLQRVFGHSGDRSRAVKRLVDCALLTREGSPEKQQKNTCKRPLRKDRRPRVYVFDQMKMRATTQH
jgi:hypothetical protein